MNTREMNVLQQMMMDATDSKGMTINGNAIQQLVKKYSKDSLEEGDMVLKTEMGSKGGFFTLVNVVKMRREWKGYTSYADCIYMNMDVLVEPPNYFSANVEPYNRQSPYYIGKRIANLTENNIDGWVVRTTLPEDRERKSAGTFSIDGLYSEREEYNIVRASFVIEPSLVQTFLNEYMVICGIPQEIIEGTFRLFK